MSSLAIYAKDLRKSYRMGRTTLKVLRGVSFSVASGEFVAIVGASGSGKSTLLHLAGLLDRPDEGVLELDGLYAADLPEWKRNRLRCQDVGFVFQFYHLLPELNVLENALLPAMVDSPIFGWPRRRRPSRAGAAKILDRLGLSERLEHKPGELSGGERQRVAIARALMNEAKLILADEPTGNLDSKTGAKILHVLKQFHDAGQTILMVTHDAAIAAQADRVLHLKDGRLAEKG